jgi:uncharacterized protein YdhG (YjbR/CyaY superfamily)
VSDAKLSAEERQAMKEYMAEKKMAAKRAKTEGEDALNLADVLAKIEAMAPADRAIAQGIHELIGKVAPSLKAKTWYGMQAYFLDGKIVCFFQDGGKFKSRYSTLGFQQDAALDDGAMWPTSFAVLELTPAVIDRITDLLRKSIGK